MTSSEHSPETQAAQRHTAESHPDDANEQSNTGSANDQNLVDVFAGVDCDEHENGKAGGKRRDERRRQQTSGIIPIALPPAPHVLPQHSFQSAVLAEQQQFLRDRREGYSNVPAAAVERKTTVVVRGDVGRHT